MDFDLGEYLPYQARRAGSTVESSFWDSMKSFRITVEEWRVLSVLYSNGPQTLNELAKRTAVNLSTLSRLIGRMDKRGYVSRRRPEDNQRSVVIALRKKGLDKTERLIPHCIRYEEMILEHFSKAEQAQLSNLLVKLYDILDDNPYDPSRAFDKTAK